MFKNRQFFDSLLHPGRITFFQILISSLMFISGCLCIIFTDRILELLPFILGSILIMLSILRFSQVFIDLKYTKDEAFVAGNGTLYLVLGIIILLKGGGAYYMIGIVWGMLGLIRDSRNFTNLIFRLIQKEETIKDSLWHLIYSLFGISISIMLLFDPPEHLHFHIMVFGLELFDSSFRILRDGIKYDLNQSLI